MNKTKYLLKEDKSNWTFSILLIRWIFWVFHSHLPISSTMPVSYSNEMRKRINIWRENVNEIFAAILRKILSLFSHHSKILNISKLHSLKDNESLFVRIYEHYEIIIIFYWFNWLIKCCKLISLSTFTISRFHTFTLSNLQTSKSTNLQTFTLKCHKWLRCFIAVFK
jgi:hypothetical protein